MSTLDDVTQIFRAHRKTSERIDALVGYIDGEKTWYFPTGTPGSAESEEEIAPGLVVYRNGNGSVIGAEITI